MEIQGYFLTLLFVTYSITCYPLTIESFEDLVSLFDKMDLMGATEAIHHRSVLEGNFQ